MGQGEPDRRPLIGREQQEAAARPHLRAGGGVLLVGGPGVGKTALARALVDSLEADGHAVEWLLAGAAGPTIPFGAFAPLAPGVGGDGTLSQDGFDLLQRLRRAVLARADGRTLVLAVDDAHRLDDASATLVFQLVSAGHAAAVATVRAGTPMPEGMRSLWKDGLLERLDLQALEREHTIALARELFGGQVDGDLGEALWQLSRGNPLYLRELVAASRAAGTVTARHGVWRRRAPLTAGPRLSELIQERLARVGRNEMATLELVAFGDPVPLGILTRMTPSAHVSSLQRQGLLVIEYAGGEEQVRSGHPIYGEVIRSTLPAPRAHDLQAELAAAFESGGRLERDLLRVVSWRLEAAGWGGIGTSTGGGGGRAGGRATAGETGETGGLDLASLLAASEKAAEQHDWPLSGRLALAALTRTKEPRATIALATALSHEARYQEALAALANWPGSAGWQGHSDDELARVAVLRASVLYLGLGRVDEADATLEAAEVRIIDPSIRTWLEAIRANAWTLRGRAPEAAARIEPRLEQDGLTPRALVAGRSALALAWAWAGRGVDAVEAAESCRDTPLRDADEAPLSMHWSVLANLSAYRLAGRVHDLDTRAATEYARAVRLHNASDQGIAIGSLGWVSLVQGRLLSAIDHFREAIAVLDMPDLTDQRGLSLAGLIESLALAGDPRGAEAALADVIGGGPDDEGEAGAAGSASASGIARAEGSGGGWAEGSDGAITRQDGSDGPITPPVSPGVAISHAWLSAANGELSRAVEEFLAAAGTARAHGHVLFEMLALHAAARLGEGQVAARLAEMANRVQGPIIQAAAMQAAAMAAGRAEGMDRAADAWERLTMWLHAAECSALARQMHLLEGSRRGAAASASRAEGFLDRCDGPRPIGPTVSLVAPALTRREREVALLAESGLSSQAIAERLYLSVRTVDSHLARIYTKLGITGRRELTAALASLPAR